MYDHVSDAEGIRPGTSNTGQVNLCNRMAEEGMCDKHDKNYVSKLHHILPS